MVEGVRRMFDFQKELLRYTRSREVSEVKDPAKGDVYSGDETRDILDIARIFAENEVVGTRAAKLSSDRQADSSNRWGN